FHGGHDQATIWRDGIPRTARPLLEFAPTVILPTAQPVAPEPPPVGRPAGVAIATPAVVGPGYSGARETPRAQAALVEQARHRGVDSRRRPEHVLDAGIMVRRGRHGWQADEDARGIRGRRMGGVTPRFAADRAQDLARLAGDPIAVGRAA